MPTSAGSGIAGSPRRIRHRKPRPLGARLHHWGPQLRVANLFVVLASWHSFALFRRQTREKEEGNETNRIASARDEGSPKGEGITRVVTSASRHRASRKTPSESRNSHTRIASTLFAVLPGIYPWFYAPRDGHDNAPRADEASKRTLFSALTNWPLGIGAARASQQQRSR